jgi:hypothetical protein
MDPLRRLAQLLLIGGTVTATQSRAAAQEVPLPPPPPPAADTDSPSPPDPLPPVPPSLAPLPPPAPPAPASTPAASPSNIARPADTDDRGPDSGTAEDAPDEPPTPDPWGGLPLVLEAQFGLGAPLGFVGVALDYSPVPAIGINLGVGLGGAGPQYALSTRLRVFRFGHRAHFAPTPARGRQAQTTVPPSNRSTRGRSTPGSPLDTPSDCDGLPLSSGRSAPMHSSSLVRSLFAGASACAAPRRLV